MSSKKEEKRRIREEKHVAGQRRDKLIGLALKISGVVLVPLILFVLYQGLSTNAQVLSPAQMGANDQVRGAQDAAVTLTIYGDFECPACREEALLLSRAWPRVGERAKLIFRHFPLDIHRHAFLAARYAEAAGRQDKFWAMHDQLYANQDLWTATEEAQSLFDTYAENIGLDMLKLKSDMELPEIRDKILSDQRGGIKAGVRSTPTLYVNGRQVNNPRSVTEVVNLVARAEQAAK